MIWPPLSLSPSLSLSLSLSLHNFRKWLLSHRKSELHLGLCDNESAASVTISSKSVAINDCQRIHISHCNKLEAQLTPFRLPVVITSINAADPTTPNPSEPKRL